MGALAALARLRDMAQGATEEHRTMRGDPHEITAMGARASALDEAADLLEAALRVRR